MNLENLPEQLEFKLPYSDNVGEQFKIVYIKEKKDIMLYQGKDSIIISKGAELDWLIDRLRDIKTLVKEEESIKKKADKYGYDDQ